MPDPDSTPKPSRPGSQPSAPSASHYMPELPFAEELQAMLEGRYLVESFLGQGGMGAVYKGSQLPLKRPVAIKILQKQAAGDDFDFEERFKREAYAMASLTHPHIVQVYDCGEAGENFLFISMELLEGGDLSDAIKAGTVTPEVALKLIGQICDGLQAAHERGIVHRDIKPANIFLTADGKPKVADFGLAKKFDVKSTFVTKTGLGMGTPDYAAPEQYEPELGIDHRADIYALGVMFYQMLTGKLPRGMWQPPSRLVSIDPRLDDIVSRAMMPDREERWQSAAEMKAAISGIVTQPLKPTTAVRTGVVPTAARPATPTPAPARPTAQPATRTSAVPVTHAAMHTPVSAPPPKKSNTGLIFGVVGGLAVAALGAFFAFKKPAAAVKAGSPGQATVSRSPVDAAFMAEVAAATPERQVELVEQKIEAINGKPVRANADVRLGSVFGFTVLNEGDGSGVKDLSPLAALKGLKQLRLYNLNPADLEFVRGLSLELLTIQGGGSFTDLSPLKGLPLKQIGLQGAQAGCNWPVLAELPLKSLDVGKCPVSDFSFIRGMPLVEIKGELVAARDAEILRSIPTLTKINDRPAAEFWATAGQESAPLSLRPATTTPTGVLTYNGHRYQFIPEKLSWTEAKAKAESLGGHLATITSKEENDWIRSTFVTKLPVGLGAWLGASHGGTPGQWRWVTGEPFSYTNWGPGEPQNVLYEPAVSFANSDRGAVAWFDMKDGELGGSLDRRAGFLVEWDDTGSKPPTPTMAAGTEKWVDVLAQWWTKPAATQSFARESGNAARATGRTNALMAPQTDVLKDQAVRATVRLNGAAYFQLLVRRSLFTGGAAHYKASLEPGESKIRIALNHPDYTGDRVLADVKLPAGFDPAAAHVLELRALADTVSVSLDGVKVFEKTDAKLTSGYPALVASEGVIIERFEQADLGGTAPAPESSAVLTFGGHRYELVSGAVTWEQADAKARAMGGHLAALTSNAECDYLASALDGRVPPGGAWIGGFMKDNETWAWVTGEPFDFMRWKPGQPDRSGRHMVLSATGQWDDGPSSAGRSTFLVEWGDAGSSPTPALTLTGKEDGTVNLLALVNPDRDKIEGDWKLVNGELRGNGGFGRLAFNYQPPAEYDFRIRFTRLGGTNAVTQHVVVGRHDVIWGMGGFGNKVWGLELVGGAGGNANATTVNSGIENGRRYESVVKVRRDRVQVEVDGKQVVDYKTDGSDLSTNQSWRFPDPKKLGVGCQTDTVFHSIEVIPFTDGAAAPSMPAAVAITPSVPPVTSAPLPPAPTTPKQTVDLIALIDPVKDRTVSARRAPQANQWEKAGTVLTYRSDGAPGRITAPVSLNEARDYEVGLLLRRHSGSDPFVLVLPVSLQKQAGLEFNQGGIELRVASEQSVKIGNWPANAAGDMRVVARLRYAPNGKDGSLAVSINGLPVGKWEGPLREVGGMGLEFHPEFPGQQLLSFASARDSFAFAAWQLRVYEGEAKVLRSAPVAGAAPPRTPPATADTNKPGKELFDGRTLNGWRLQGSQDAFVVEDRCIKATGNKATLMFSGNADVSADMEDFDLTMKVKTGGNANSGVFIHCRRNTDGQSFINGVEIQLANENRDPQKTGSIWGIQPVSDIIVHDGEWFDFRISVKDKTVTAYINGKKVNEWTQPAGWNGAQGKPDAKLGQGTIGLQSNGGSVWFKDIEISVP